MAIGSYRREPTLHALKIALREYLTVPRSVDDLIWVEEVVSLMDTATQNPRLVPPTWPSTSGPSEGTPTERASGPGPTSGATAANHRVQTRLRLHEVSRARISPLLVLTYLSSESFHWTAVVPKGDVRDTIGLLL